MQPSPVASAASATASSSTAAGGATSGTATAPFAPFQAVSPGRIRVAMRPGAVIASAIAFAPSAATVVESRDVWTQCDTGLAMPSMSAVSGASCSMWKVACSPTMLTMPECAFFALCRLATALPSPGPRCSSVAAGRFAMRQ